MALTDASFPNSHERVSSMQGELRAISIDLQPRRLRRDPTRPLLEMTDVTTAFLQSGLQVNPPAGSATQWYTQADDMTVAWNELPEYEGNVHLNMFYFNSSGFLITDLEECEGDFLTPLEPGEVITRKVGDDLLIFYQEPDKVKEILGVPAPRPASRGEVWEFVTQNVWFPIDEKVEYGCNGFCKRCLCACKVVTPADHEQCKCEIYPLCHSFKDDMMSGRDSVDHQNDLLCQNKCRRCGGSCFFKNVMGVHPPEEPLGESPCECKDYPSCPKRRHYEYMPSETNKLSPSRMKQLARKHRAVQAWKDKHLGEPWRTKFAFDLPEQRSALQAIQELNSELEAENEVSSAQHSDFRSQVDSDWSAEVNLAEYNCVSCGNPMKWVYYTHVGALCDNCFPVLASWNLNPDQVNRDSEASVVTVMPVPVSTASSSSSSWEHAPQGDYDSLKMIRMERSLKVSPIQCRWCKTDISSINHLQSDNNVCPWCKQRLCNNCRPGHRCHQLPFTCDVCRASTHDEIRCSDCNRFLCYLCHWKCPCQKVLSSSNPGEQTRRLTAEEISALPEFKGPTVSLSMMSRWADYPSSDSSESIKSLKASCNDLVHQDDSSCESHEYGDSPAITETVYELSKNFSNTNVKDSCGSSSSTVNCETLKSSIPTAFGSAPVGRKRPAVSVTVKPLTRSVYRPVKKDEGILKFQYNPDGAKKVSHVNTRAVGKWKNTLPDASVKKFRGNSNTVSRPESYNALGRFQSKPEGSLKKPQYTTDVQDGIPQDVKKTSVTTVSINLEKPPGRFEEFSSKNNFDCKKRLSFKGTSSADRERSRLRPQESTMPSPPPRRPDSHNPSGYRKFDNAWRQRQIQQGRHRSGQRSPSRERARASTRPSSQERLSSSRRHVSRERLSSQRRENSREYLNSQAFQRQEDYIKGLPCVICESEYHNSVTGITCIISPQLNERLSEVILMGGDALGNMHSSLECVDRKLCKNLRHCWNEPAFEQTQRGWVNISKMERGDDLWSALGSEFICSFVQLINLAAEEHEECKARYHLSKCHKFSRASSGNSNPYYIGFEEACHLRPPYPPLFHFTDFEAIENISKTGNVSPAALLKKPEAGRHPKTELHLSAVNFSYRKARAERAGRKYKGDDFSIEFDFNNPDPVSDALKTKLGARPHVVTEPANLCFIVLTLNAAGL